jgi:hypothetical protein
MGVVDTWARTLLLFQARQIHQIAAEDENLMLPSQEGSSLKQSCTMRTEEFLHWWLISRNAI